MKKLVKTKAKPVVDDDDPLAGDMSDFISKAKWRETRFILAAKNATVTIRIPKSFVDLAKKVADKKGIKCHKMMRDAIPERRPLPQ